MPVVVAIQGGCIGGAVEMVTACCIRYATRDAFFCIQEINIGMVADVGTLQRLPKLMPMAVAKELAYTGRRLSAEKAMGYGLVNEVFADAPTMLAAAMQCATEIAAKSPSPFGVPGRRCTTPETTARKIRSSKWVGYKPGYGVPACRRGRDGHERKTLGPIPKP